MSLLLYYYALLFMQQNPFNTLLVVFRYFITFRQRYRVTNASANKVVERHYPNIGNELAIGP